MAGMNRRRVLRTGAAAIAASSFGRLWARESLVADTLAPVADSDTGLPLLKLLEGFSYRSFSWTGDAMAGGGATPARHDGMAAFSSRGGDVMLLRNHEEIIGARIGGAGVPTYDDLEIPPGTDGAADGFPGFSGGVTGSLLRSRSRAHDGGPACRDHRELRGRTDCLEILADLRGDHPPHEPDRRQGSWVCLRSSGRRGARALARLSTWACSGTRPRRWIRRPASST